MAIRKLGVYRRGTILLKLSQILAYANDIDIIAKSIDDLKQNFNNIKETTREIGLEINEEETKILVSTTSRARAARIGQTLTIGDYNFQIVNTFKYLGTSINNENNISVEIKENRGSIQMHIRTRQTSKKSAH